MSAFVIFGIVMTSIVILLWVSAAFEDDEIAAGITKAGDYLWRVLKEDLLGFEPLDNYDPLDDCAAHGTINVETGEAKIDFEMDDFGRTIGKNYKEFDLVDRKWKTWP